MNSEEKNTLPVVIAGVILIVVISIGILLFLNNRNTTTNNTLSANTYTSTGSSQVYSRGNGMMGGNSIMNFKDGSYNASGSYFAPSGYETIGVQIGVSKGIISSVSITPDSNDFQSLRYQQRFMDGLNSLVVGKSLDQAYIYGRVNGASLTPLGFNNALDQIIQQSKIN